MYHFLFVPLTLGMAFLLAIMETGRTRATPVELDFAQVEKA
jgi:cytochrome bd-type quinol oxidase subunit 1